MLAKSYLFTCLCWGGGGLFYLEWRRGGVAKRVELLVRSLDEVRLWGLDLDFCFLLWSLSMI